MRREESKFASPDVHKAALRLAPTIRMTRLSRNMTQEAAAARARMSAFTWMKIEKGDVSVSLGAWLSALECLGLLDTLKVGVPSIETLTVTQAPHIVAGSGYVGPPPVKWPVDSATSKVRQRARRSPSKDKEFDF